MLKPPVPKFRSDLSVRLGDIAEKQVPAKLKPIVVWVLAVAYLGMMPYRPWHHPLAPQAPLLDPNEGRQLCSRAP